MPRLALSVVSFLILGTASAFYLFSALGETVLYNAWGYTIYADFESAAGLGPGTPAQRNSPGSSTADPASASVSRVAGDRTTLGGTTKEDPYPTLGPLLSRRAAAYAAGAASGTSDSTDPAEIVRLTIYVDSQERIAAIAAFLARRGGTPGRPVVGHAGDVFGGALPATVPVSLLADLAVQPGVRYVREQIPLRIDRTAPPPSFPADAEAAHGG